jgi:hypothetical protein
VFLLESKKRMHLHPDLEFFGRSSLPLVITLKNLDVFDVFYGRKNGHLGVKGNTAYILYMTKSADI